MPHDISQFSNKRLVDDLLLRLEILKNEKRLVFVSEKKCNQIKLCFVRF